MGEFTYKEAERYNTEVFNTQRLTPACITFSENFDHLTLLLRRSKADRQGAGVYILVGAAPDEACPVHHMRALLGERRIQHDTSRAQPLFHLTTGAFTREQALRHLQARLQRLGIPGASLKGHSFRKGAAQHAADQGLSKQEIQTLGRWSSDAVDLYLKTSRRELFALQRRFTTGRAPPFTSS